MGNRIKYSQNFLRSDKLVKDLVSGSGISSNDTVYEIGAGEGIITKELLEKAKEVVAFELDRNLFNKLAQKFQNDESLELRLEDFLNSNLPNYTYKVFSNIPFNITSAIIKKLTLESNPPEGAHLIVQKEPAMKFAGKPLSNKNSQMAVILNPWFSFSFKHQFKSGDFSPRPGVNVVLLKIKKRKKPLIDNKNRSKYEDFNTYSFSQTKPNISEGLENVFGKQKMMKLAKRFNFSAKSKPSELDFENWRDLFNEFLEAPYKQQVVVKDSFAKQLKQQENIEKINRTRVDKNWRKHRH